MKAMILAAGYGTRMGELTQYCPKPLLKAAGKPLIFYHLEALKQAGIEDVVINTGWLGHMLEEAIADGTRFGLRVSWSREGEPLETAGGIRKALPLLGDEPFLVVNGDIWTDKDYATIQLPEGQLASLVLVDNPEHHLAGDFTLSSSGVVQPKEEGQTFTFSGLGCYHPALFSQYGVDEDKLGIVLREAMADGKVSGEHFTGAWWDIGTPERLQHLEQLIQAGELCG